MTGRFTLSPRAQGDILDIWDHTAERWGKHQAETYIGQLGARIALIASEPARGRACPEIRPGYHRARSGSHVVFYRITADGIEVVRVLHERMDLSRHLTPDDDPPNG